MHILHEHMVFLLFLLLMLLLLLMLMTLPVTLTFSGFFLFQDCRMLLDRIKRDQAALQSGAYTVTSCPICLEELAMEVPEQVCMGSGVEYVDVLIE